MNSTSNFEVRTADTELINNVRTQVDELYQKQQIFILSLETLELTRRFNAILSSENSLEEMKPAAYSRLLTLTRHLERNLVRETV